MKIHTTAQIYFQKHPVKSFGGGAQFDVYAAPDFVVKVFSKARMKRTAALWDRSDMARVSGMSEEVRKSMPQSIETVTGMLERERGAWKDHLGSWVVPFQVVDPLSLRVRNFLGLESVEFVRDAIVQTRVSAEALLPQHFAVLHARGDVAAIADVVEKAFATFDGLMRAGYFPYDSKPTNFCWHLGAVKLLDLGALCKVANARGMLTRDVGEGSREMSLSRWVSALTGDEEPNGSLQPIVKGFTSRFRKMHTWSHVHSLEVHGRRARLKPADKRVPDVFPFEETSARRSWFRWW